MGSKLGSHIRDEGRSKVEKHEYTLKADLKPMEETIAEKDVGVTIDNKLSFDKHITEKVNKANSIIGVIRRTIRIVLHLSGWNFNIHFSES
jgi:hypothetical protein